MLPRAENIELPFIIVGLAALENPGNRGMTHRIDMDGRLYPGNELPVSPDIDHYLFPAARHAHLLLFLLKKCQH